MNMNTFELIEKNRLEEYVKSINYDSLSYYENHISDSIVNFILNNIINKNERYNIIKLLSNGEYIEAIKFLRVCLGSYNKKNDILLLKKTYQSNIEDKTYNPSLILSKFIVDKIFSLYKI